MKIAILIHIHQLVSDIDFKPGACLASRDYFVLKVCVTINIHNNNACGACFGH